MSNNVWLAADYRFSALYSCRVPLSSDFSALALPAPGPATVRLALIRAGIELFGLAKVRDELFSTIQEMNVVIRPPDCIGISSQIVRGYKTTDGHAPEKNHIRESVIVREYCHAKGALRIFINIPVTAEWLYRELLEAIGYWGQANSLTYCTEVAYRNPRAGEGVISLASIPATNLGGTSRQYLTTVLSEFRDTAIEWAEILPVVNSKQSEILATALYIWPLEVIEQQSTHKTLRYRSLEDIMKA